MKLKLDRFLIEYRALDAKSWTLSLRLQLVVVGVVHCSPSSGPANCGRALRCIGIIWGFFLKCCDSLVCALLGTYTISVHYIEWAHHKGVM